MMSALYSEPIVLPCMAVKLLVMQPVFRRAPMRRSASTISGRISPLSRGSTSRPSTSWPSARLSAANRAPKASASISLRSSRAHAFSCGLVALTVRRNPVGRPRSASKRANASKGLDEITPPKSQMTAFTADMRYIPRMQ